MQNVLFEPQQNAQSFVQLPMQDADVRYYPQWLTSSESDNYFTELVATLDWRQDTIKLYGKEHLIPRLQAWYGDPEAEYEYSGLPLVPLSWTKALQQLKRRCETVTGTSFNSVLANWYRHGQDSMGMHSDDEPQLGSQPVIGSISLGEERKLVFKHKQTKQRIPITLQHGSLLIMAGETQHYWQHGINKTAKPIEGRINLTFRRIYNDSTTTHQR